MWWEGVEGDVYSTANVTVNGLSQRTFGPFDGQINMAQALLQIGAATRLEGSP